MTDLRIGYGYDVHRLVPGRALVLGGVTVPFEKGLLGHSDADVLTHAVMDALLGAAALGDIGKLFPDSDARYAGADSTALLRQVTAVLAEAGWTIVNVTLRWRRRRRSWHPISRRCGRDWRRPWDWTRDVSL